MKTWLKYLLFLLFLVAFITISTEISVRISESAQSTYNILQYVVTNYLIYVLVGVLIGAEQLFFNKKHSRIGFNKSRFLLLALPFFIFSSWHLFMISGLLDIRVNNFYLNGTFLNLCQVLFGYLLMTSFIHTDSEKVVEK